MQKNALEKSFLSSIKLDLGSTSLYSGLPGGSDSKESACNAGDLGLIAGSGKSPEKGIPTPVFQYSCLYNSMDR